MPELGLTRRSPAEVVVNGSPIDLARLVDPGCPIRRATYDSVEVGQPSLADLLAPLVAEAFDRRLDPDAVEPPAR